MSWTSTDDVIGSWIGDDAPTNTAQVQVWIDRAERMLRQRFTTLQTRIDEGEPDLLETVKDTVSAMVQRVFRNPEGIRQTSVTTGPFSEQRTYGGNQPGALYIADEEAGALTGRVVSGAYEIDPLIGYTYPGSGPVIL
ncbi:hypothetical protein [Curtobacterium luteum]|uniref:hypothetical protein n=1 Tax=Curtobacterium luteum TaxID=33881 RepID=UPI000736B78E|nr:hypothetical protein [Curtobacterium luteum]